MLAAAPIFSLALSQCKVVQADLQPGHSLSSSWTVLSPSCLQHWFPLPPPPPPPLSEAAVVCMSAQTSSTTTTPSPGLPLWIMAAYLLIRMPDAAAACMLHERSAAVGIEQH